MPVLNKGHHSDARHDRKSSVLSISWFPGDTLRKLPKPIAMVGLEFSLMDVIQLLFSDHSDKKKLKSEETLFVCSLISRGNSVLHVPSVNHPYFNQYLLHQPKRN